MLFLYLFSESNGHHKSTKDGGKERKQKAPQEGPQLASYKPWIYGIY